ncbi:multicopper oxidase family protein [Streptomyces sp. NPDC006739]|uniref:multicopper oxidase family protein n=1 Tax=Streptomyces sp. NPDC006739 TaxID=3364763 RepID=UPI00367DBEBD
MHALTRRTLLSASIAATGLGALTACSGSGSHTGPGRHPGSGAEGGSGGGFVPRGPGGFVHPSGPQVIAAERKRGTGPLRSFTLTAAETRIDLGGRTVRTWAYGDSLPGREVRVNAGDLLDITLANHLPVETTMHAHGVRMRCDMDGVPDLTQKSVRPGERFGYRFAVAHPGTYVLHSHVGLQPDRGLYAPLIIQDPREPLAYDKEWVLVLDDWLDGVGGSTPDGVLTQLRGGKAAPMAMGTGHGGAPSTGPSRMLHGGRSRMLHSEGGSVAYPYYLVNGRVPAAPSVFRARPGDRIRLRIINAGSETAFRVALGGHTMTVTHTDGYPVEHTKTDTLLVGMAERYDVLVTAQDGVFPLVALAEGKNGQALALLRTGKGKSVPAPDVRPDELDGECVPARRLVPQEQVALGERHADREMRIRLTGGMRKFDWGFDHRPYSVEQRHPVREGERVRLTLINATDMWHPLHLHGHTFALNGLDSVGTRKDTALVLPHRKLVIDFIADNPGLWMLHCHNQYHSESGMMTVVGYRT